MPRPFPGEREVLGFTPGDTDSRAAWDAFLDNFKRRGLATADLWIADGGPAAIGAVEAKLPGTVRQLCVVRKVENILAHGPKAKHDKVRNELNRIIYLAANREK